uniref:Class I SAM-dependent methyltransferase n=1 Tax=Coccolithus braarudii TaxID=221442 RepID=A0A7S0L8H8_9EUKA|mmetsp:Transcript_23984/g.51719  ORF Transcript_23984/g.51719 Transcript_23984/m.51719 type:complete len:356 (+) Transcript_23984:20-1087(+)
MLFDQYNVTAEMNVTALREGKLVEPRFTPRDSQETLSIVFEWWNLLDAVMHKLDPLYGYQTGYVREIQLRRMVDLVRMPGVTRYCEVGMNGGHSVSAMLLANPQLKAHVFDLLAFNYSQPVVDLLTTRFRSRITVHAGWSHHGIIKWKQERRAADCPRGAPSATKMSDDESECPMCDLIFVDGDHTYKGALDDLMALKSLAAPGAMVVVDDVGMPPGKAFTHMEAIGKIRRLEQYGPFPPRHRLNPCMRVIDRTECRQKVESMTDLVLQKGLGGREKYIRRCAIRAPICLEWGFAVGEYVAGPGRAHAAAANSGGAVGGRAMNRITARAHGTHINLDTMRHRAMSRVMANGGTRA